MPKFRQAELVEEGHKHKFKNAFMDILKWR